MSAPSPGTDRAEPDTSQNGEEEVLRSILAKLPDPVGWIVEFGAWDGLHLSNSYPFISKDGWRAVLIEGDPELHRQLVANWRGNDRVIPLHRMVGWGPDDGLDAILEQTPIEREFDVASIDIDGNDFHVWEAFERYRPRVVVIEFNHTIPNAVDFVQPADPSLNHGSSLRALVRLAESKDYELAATTRFNAFFVDRKYFGDLGLESNSIEDLHPVEDAVTHFFVGYDGTVFLRGSAHMPWHGIDISESRLQVLPGYLRRFPQSYNRWQLGLFYAFRAVDILRQAPSLGQGLKELRRRWRGHRAP